MPINHVRPILFVGRTECFKSVTPYLIHFLIIGNGQAIRLIRAIL